MDGAVICYSREEPESIEDLEDCRPFVARSMRASSADDWREFHKQKHRLRWEVRCTCPLEL